MKHNQKVQLREYFSRKISYTGSIVGMGHIDTGNGMRPVYLMQLDEGFYNPGETTFVSILVVDRDSNELEPIP